MVTTPMDVLKEFPVRKTKKQKKAFRDAILSYASDLNYPVSIENGSLGSKNVVFGNPDTANYLFTAHYDTCARMIVPNLITPCNVWTFLAYQIFVVLIMLLLPLLPGLLTGVLTDSFEAGYLVWYFCFLAVFILMFFGPANLHNANDNTSGVITVLRTMKDLPQQYRDKVCFILFDLEEMGLIGSKSYRNSHKTATENQIILNLDCVGDGDEILLFPTKKLRTDADKMALLRQMNCTVGDKQLKLHEKGFSVYPSDQRNFPYGVGIAAFHRKKGVGLYCGRIHTHRDTVLDEENVNILRDRLMTVITG